MILLALAIGILFMAFLVLVYRAGKSDEKRSSLEDDKTAQARAQLARDRLRRDFNYADRVRKRFTR